MLDEEDLAEAKEQLTRAKKPNKVIIRIHCRDLLDVDTFSKSDPFAMFFMKGEQEKKWRYVGRTETQTDKLDP